jgi:putative ABC transport system permease protein
LPLREVLVGQYRPAFVMLFAAVGFLLTIGCANAASLLLARAAARRKEMAILQSFGASRMSIAGQLGAESLVLACLGGLVGTAIAFFSVRAVSVWGPAYIPRLSSARVDLPVLVFALCVSVLAGVGVGSAPAIAFLRGGIGNALKQEAAGSAFRLGRLGPGPILAVEFALALMLLVGAGLSARSFFNLTRVEPGFDPDRVLSMRLSLPRADYGEPSAPAETSRPRPAPADAHSSDHNNDSFRAARFYTSVVARLESIPGVTAAGAVSHLPLGDRPPGEVWIDVSNKRGGLAQILEVQGDFFSAMGIPVLAGRSFLQSDTRHSLAVAVISDSLAKLYWPAGNAVGASFNIPTSTNETQPRLIIGVVGDIRYSGLASEIRPQFYLPCAQPYGGVQPPLDMAVVVKTRLDPRPLGAYLRQAVASIDPSLPAYHITSLTEVVDESMSEYRFRGVLLGLFALLATLLTAAGVYGVVSYSVVSRTREIGIRMSIGAGRKSILTMVLRETAVIALAGAAMGAIGSVALSRLISGFLFGILPMDPATMIGATSVLVLAALGASLRPAVAASRVEPAVVLRYE